MAALRKQKKYNWKETNLALFGSELEKQVKEVVNDGLMYSAISMLRRSD